MRTNDYHETLNYPQLPKKSIFCILALQENIRMNIQYKVISFNKA